MLRLTETNKGFELVFHELKGKESVLVFEDSKVEVYTIPLNHRIYCNGYLFKEKPKERHLMRLAPEGCLTNNQPMPDRYPINLIS